MADTQDSHEPARIVQWREGEPPREVDDAVAREEPLEIRVRGRSISVTMRTPGHDDELAIGFLLSEGLIAASRDVVRVEPSARHPEGNVINVFLAPHVEVDFDRLTRHVFASSSCGLCGKASIEQVQCHFTPIPTDDNVRIAAEALQRLPDVLRAGQDTFDRTGGLHAAGLFDVDGTIIALREDVGRHNAVDKVLGDALLRDRLPLDRHVLMVSGRASFEIMQKALAGRVPILAAVSAPSSLAVEMARDSGQTLVGFLRPGRMNVYTHPQRVTM
ncbi:MAG: formate dehydrogenase accessory sulfurtransferase FdhD [Phycisphaera sp.]|nr:formate dehydrogenase accessory sulfurtransferase FdhD [Phycisphaera sp.]